MIEIPETRVLRYSKEEIRRMQRPRNTPPGVDWLGTKIMRENPDWHIETMVMDERTMHYYVILTKEPVVTIIRRRRRGFRVWEEEEIA